MYKKKDKKVNKHLAVALMAIKNDFGNGLVLILLQAITPIIDDKDVISQNSQI